MGDLGTWTARLGAALALAVAVAAVWLAAAEEDPTMTAFETWHRLNGAETGLECVNIASAGGARATLAAMDMPAGQAVIRVPRGAILAASDARTGDGTQGLAPHIAEHIQDFANRELAAGNSTFSTSGRMVLAVLLMWHRRIGASRPTRWSAYVNMLPDRVPGLPRNLDPETRAILDNTAALAMADARDGRLAQEFEHLRHDFGHVCKARPWFNETHYFWARDMVDSRSFMLPLDDASDEMVAMVPLADIPNHANENCALSHRLDERGDFVATSRCDLRQGDAVHNWYGDWSNSALMAQWGFALDFNPYDSVRLVLEDGVGERLNCVVFAEEENGIHEHCVRALVPAYQASLGKSRMLAAGAALAAVSSAAQLRLRGLEASRSVDDVLELLAADLNAFSPRRSALLTWLSEHETLSLTLQRVTEAQFALKDVMLADWVQDLFFSTCGAS